jgi:predicted metal-dependent phosphoesterase TrpH
VSGPLRIDLHNHTHHSSDGTLPPRRLLELAAARGLDCLAVTDHDTLAGGLECAALAERDPGLPRVIPGQEVSTREGELVGLFLTRQVPAGLALMEAAERIHAQGGLVYLPHPFDTIRRGTVLPSHLARASLAADIIEVRNGRMLRESFNAQAEALARRLDKPRGAGSDAHFAGEVGRAFVEIGELPTRETLADLLKEGELGRPLSVRGRSLAWFYALRTGAGKTRSAVRRTATRRR